MTSPKKQVNDAGGTGEVMKFLKIIIRLFLLFLFISAFPPSFIKKQMWIWNKAKQQVAAHRNDPNGNLSKAGGYTACVYFSSDLVNQDEVYGDTVIDKGTDGGGAVEVYSSVEDANTRNDYLASFDGAGFLASGSHSVVGTVVIRTSDNLTATQQKEMEANIYNSLVELR